MANTSKPCIKCGSVDRDKHSHCKPCKRAAQARYCDSHKEKVKASSAAYYAANKEKLLASKRACWAANPEKYRARVAAWQAANPEKKRASDAAYYAANKRKCLARQAVWKSENYEKYRAINSAWSAANPEKVKALRVKWRVANREKCSAATAKWAAVNREKVRKANRVYQQNRDARKRANGGKLSKDIAERLFKLQKGKCPCCGEPLGNDYHLDHITPIVLGGANEDWNIQLLRSACNNQKRARHPVDFMQSKGFLL